MRHWLTTAWPLGVALTASLLAAGCQNELGTSTDCETGSCDAGPTIPPGDPKFDVDPPLGLGFDCVRLGCETERIVTIKNDGGGVLALTVLRLTATTTRDITVQLFRGDPAVIEAAEDGEMPDLGEPIAEPTAEAPLEIIGGTEVHAVVRYVPTDGQPDDGVLWIEHHDAAIAYDDAVVSTVELPLRTRVLGTAAAELVFDELNFGYVAPGESDTQNIEVVNTGMGDALMSVLDVRVAPGSSAAFTVEQPEIDTANPSDRVFVPVHFEPTEPGVYEGVVILETNDPMRGTLEVPVLGTAFETGQMLLVQPTSPELLFGALRAGEGATRTVEVRNAGGTPLVVTPRLVSGALNGFSLSVSDSEPLPALAPLQTATFDVLFQPNGGGDKTGTLRLDSDANEADLEIHLEGVANAPELGLTQGSVDMGSVVQGWTSDAHAIGITNDGTGELTVQDIRFEVGSSSQMQFANLPPLPLKIQPGEDPFEFSIYLQASNVGPADATILVQTDSITETIVRVPVTARVVTCQEGCPIPHGTPDCSSGSCRVDMCSSGYHNLDGNVGNGCECLEDRFGSDVGATCSSGVHGGTINDDDSPRNVSYAGTLHAADDRDVYFVHANDQSQWFSDDAGVEVTLVSGPPGLALCANIVKGNDGCGGYVTAFDANKCVQGNGARIRQTSNGTGDDSRDVTVTVMWHPTASPVCSEYNIRIRGDAG